MLRKEIETTDKKFVLYAEKGKDLGDGHFLINFSWTPEHLTFSEVLERSGRIPLPPYISRGDTDDDTQRYQTIFASKEGSVAAPTAGLHFTEEVMNNLQKKSILFEKVALHVGVGTFRPVSSPTLSGHIMHREKFVVSRSTLKNLIKHIDQPVIATGTTTVRTLESLYWLGAKLLSGTFEETFEIGQWDPYDKLSVDNFSTLESLMALDDFLERKKLDEINGSTELMIVPGYRFRLVNGMFTNFHLPQSTLLLLVAVFIGEAWKEVYDYALNNGFRFLSYGDSCLFFAVEGSFCIK
jgi:S-adenosylmethionine:tRNA ribosyltransferase-isomerase